MPSTSMRSTNIASTVFASPMRLGEPRPRTLMCLPCVVIFGTPLLLSMQVDASDNSRARHSFVRARSSEPTRSLREQRAKARSDVRDRAVALHRALESALRRASVGAGHGEERDVLADVAGGREAIAILVQ